MSESPLTNGHDSEANGGVVILREQLFAIRANTARQAERRTIEALCEDAKRRYVRARQAGDPKAEFDALRDLTRYELWLIRRGLV